MDTNALERLWSDLLSRQPEKVRAAYTGLTREEQQAVYTHLKRILEESGWHPEQRRSARAALLALEQPHEDSGPAPRNQV